MKTPSSNMKKKILHISLMMFILTSLSYPQKSTQFFLFGGKNYHFEYGTEKDYIVGTNDFPVNPSHLPFNFGGAFTVYFSKRIGIELDGRYTLSSKLNLVDPIDQDTLSMNSYKHLSLTANFIYQFLSKRIRPYVIIGGGFDRISAKDETYLTEYGYQIDIKAPLESELIDPLAQIGAGIFIYLNDFLGIRFDSRYIVIFDTPNNIHCFNITLGVFLSVNE